MTEPADADRDEPDDEVLAHVLYVPLRAGPRRTHPGPDDPTEEMPALWRPADEPGYDSHP